MRRRRQRWEGEIEAEITSIDSKGLGCGVAPDGRPLKVRTAIPGSRVRARVVDRDDGAWIGKRTAVIRPAPGQVPPSCPQFGVCGGCALQELPLAAQRAAKSSTAIQAALGDRAGVTVHPVRGGPRAYGYRNRVELSFGRARYLTDAEHAEGGSHDGRWLGFHAAGRFDRIADAPTCALISERANAALAIVRRHALAPDAPPVWDSKPADKGPARGFWRYLLLREGMRTGELLLAVITWPDDAHAAAMEALAADLLGAGLGVVGVEWVVHGGVADVARGDTRAVWGAPSLHEENAGGRRWRLSRASFFQTSTEGAEVLYATIGDAVGAPGPDATLLDVYCGTGSIGLVLSDGFARVVGIEENAAAIDDARRNAALSPVPSSWHVGKAEDLLPGLVAELPPGSRRSVVVDPPRVGLHPKVAHTLAALDADVLVYVACHPPSLGRDLPVLEAGGWRLTDLWTVDLFPQTGHIEVVGRLVRPR